MCLEYNAILGSVSIDVRLLPPLNPTPTPLMSQTDVLQKERAKCLGRLVFKVFKCHLEA